MISSVNLVSYKEVVKEFIQEIDSDEIAEYLSDISSGDKRKDILENIEELKSKLLKSPSVQAAKRVNEVCSKLI